MRRGLMAWSRDEIPAAILERRVARVIEGLRERSLDCLLAYTDLTRPAAVSALTHFVPYWSNGVLVVGAGIGAKFVCTLSRRVGEWMHTTARFDGLVHTLDLGAGVAQVLPRGEAAQFAVGAVDLASFPSSVVGAIYNAHPDAKLEEAGDLLSGALAGEDQSLLARRAYDIALSAVQAAERISVSGQAATVLAAAELAGRHAGAEEIQLAIAPYAASSPGLKRLEGNTLLGETFALQATVAYKGCWIRLGRTLGTGASQWGRQADAWFAQALERIASGDEPAAVMRSAPKLVDGAELTEWRIEAPVAGLPLGVVDGSGAWAAEGAARREPRSLTARLRLPQGWWFGAAPVLS